MKIDHIKRILFSVALFVSLGAAASANEIVFVPVQTELFADPGGQSNAWGDYDNDGDLDLIVTFRDAPVRLYRNDRNGFEEVGSRLGLPTDGGNPRSVAWGDYDGDGDLDLYIGYSGHDGPANRLFRNDLEGEQAGFTDVAETAGVAIQGITRQVSFIDYDADGDLDLYVALRASVNRLLQNNDGVFTDVTFSSGIMEPRRTVGACWFDMDADGDLDLFTANQNGDRDGMFRNDEGTFSDVAIELNMDSPRRPLNEGGVGCAVTDFDTDGDLDLYVAAYGDDMLYRNNGDGTFTDVAPEMGVANEHHIVTGVWGDVQHDGRPDLYIVGYINGKPRTPDYLYVNEGDHFINRLPDNVAQNDTDHGVQWADFDQDGDLDLALAANDPAGSHYLFRNDLPADIAGRSIQVLVLDAKGHYTRAGSEVRVYRTGTNDLLGLRMVDTGSGYNAQNAKPVHIGLADWSVVDVHVTTMSPHGPQVEVFRKIDPRTLAGKMFIVRVGN
ncbi:MAG: CRTAC1 family protein [Gammaproteobacteria bacterium]|nr:CRTAC1 family protein [Gammaproteobacteria bacterium]